MNDHLTHLLSLKLFSGSGTLEVPMSEVQLPIPSYYFRKASGGISLVETGEVSFAVEYTRNRPQGLDARLLLLDLLVLYPTSLRIVPAPHRFQTVSAGTAPSLP